MNEIENEEPNEIANDAAPQQIIEVQGEPEAPVMAHQPERGDNASITQNIQQLVNSLMFELQRARADAEEKEEAAKKARQEITDIETHIQGLLQNVPSSSGSAPTLPPIPRGACKFACGSNTHQYATDCDVYRTLSQRRTRMRVLRLCFKCFQQYVSQFHNCQPVPCFFCKDRNRNPFEHVSALCPYMFAQ